MLSFLALFSFGCSEEDTEKPPLSCADVELGEVEVGVPLQGTLSISNPDGLAAFLEEATVSSDALVVDPDALIFEGDNAVAFTYTPSGIGVFVESAKLSFSEPAGEVTCVVSGQATVIDRPPVAVCEAVPAQISPLDENATFRGSDSYDGNGGTLTDYAWTLVSAPEGADVLVPDTGQANWSVSPKVAGEYAASLVVTNGDGDASEPCVAELVVAPPQELWVQLSWTLPGDDLDLHLILAGQVEEPWGTGYDCGYDNCREPMSLVDWGVSGETADDPTLDQDDIEGTGPESISIPAPVSATYEVWVHDYPNNSSGHNQATVVAFAGGKELWTEVVEITSEDQRVFVGTIAF